MIPFFYKIDGPDRDYKVKDGVLYLNSDSTFYITPRTNIIRIQTKNEPNLVIHFPEDTTGGVLEVDSLEIDLMDSRVDSIQVYGRYGMKRTCESIYIHGGKKLNDFQMINEKVVKSLRFGKYRYMERIQIEDMENLQTLDIHEVAEVDDLALINCPKLDTVLFPKLLDYANIEDVGRIDPRGIRNIGSNISIFKDDDIVAEITRMLNPGRYGEDDHLLPDARGRMFYVNRGKVVPYPDVYKE